MRIRVSHHGNDNIEQDDQVYNDETEDEGQANVVHFESLVVLVLNVEAEDRKVKIAER